MFERLAGADFCYLTTVGRRTGRPHTVEMWFAIDGRTLYCLAGGGDGADWVRNIRHDGALHVRINSQQTAARGRVVRAGTSEDARARGLLDEKYMGGTPGKRLSSWARTALPVAIDLPGGRA
ncbi:MAG TPA: nitroreductase/quinone reductase family protein [Candidatus Saccharimonadales bacterium]|nr:nitroreductase/quinone reductase family protein [Candidatus Saccharimonadales bacterium]